jgi:HPt (histidine-containing phosphotransfer) domain-containing protein
MAMFHKDNCRCCNKYVVHAIRACKEQRMDLHMQDVGDAITTAWPKLMQDLKSEASSSALADYKALADKAASLQAALKTSQSTLTSERNRIERQDETIRDLKDEIATLKHPQLTALMATSSTRPVAQLSHTAGPSSCQTALLPVWAQSGLTAWISNPGLASRIEMHPETGRFDDPSGDVTNDVPDADTSMPEGWENDPNWGSDASTWEQMDGPGDTTKASSKKRKKRAHDHEHQSYGILAVHEKVTREYLAQLSTNTVKDEALTVSSPNLRSAASRDGKDNGLANPPVRGATTPHKIPGGRGTTAALGSSHTRDGTCAPPARPFGPTNRQLGRCMSSRGHTFQRAP